MKEIKQIEFGIDGMTCNSCEKIILKQVMKIEGVIDASFDYSKEFGWVKFDSNKANPDDIVKAIEEKGYICRSLQANAKGSQSVFSRFIKPSILTLGLLVILFGTYQFFEGVLVHPKEY